MAEELDSLLEELTLDRGSSVIGLIKKKKFIIFKYKLKDILQNKSF